MTEPLDSNRTTLLHWLRGTPHHVLFVTGIADAAVSSIVREHVLPVLEQEDDLRVITVPGSSDPARELEGLLVAQTGSTELVTRLRQAARDAGDRRPLVVFDRFETFLAEEQRPAATNEPMIGIVREALAAEGPFPTLLFVVRTDFVGQLPRGAPRLVLGVNWIELWGDQRIGNRGVRLQPGPDRLLASDYKRDDSNGTERP